MRINGGTLISKITRCPTVTILSVYFGVRELQVRNRGNVPGDEIEKKARNTKRHDKYETVVQFLLEHNAEVNAKDSFGRVRRS